MDHGIRRRTGVRSRLGFLRTIWLVHHDTFRHLIHGKGWVIYAVQYDKPFLPIFFTIVVKSTTFSVTIFFHSATAELLYSRKQILLILAKIWNIGPNVVNNANCHLSVRCRVCRPVLRSYQHDPTYTWAGPHSPYATSFPESPSWCRALTDATASLFRTTRPAHRFWDLGYPFYAMTKKGLEMEVILVETMMLHIYRDPIDGTTYERITFSPASENKRYFQNLHVVCDTRFLLYSQWAVGIINHQTDGTGDRDGKWEKVETRDVVTIRTKEVLRRRVTTLWL